MLNKKKYRIVKMLSPYGSDFYQIEEKIFRLFWIESDAYDSRFTRLEDAKRKIEIIKNSKTKEAVYESE